jgi:hypothetical protein
MARAGKKCQNKTDLSVFMHDFYFACGSIEKTPGFTEDTFLNFTSDKGKISASKTIKHAMKTRALTAYFSGDSTPNPGFALDVYKCMDEGKFTSWIEDDFHDQLSNMAACFQRYNETISVDKDNVASVIFESLRRIFINLQNPNAGLPLRITNSTNTGEPINSYQLREKYGSQLLKECGFKCEYKGESLLNSIGNPDYRVLVIDDALPIEVGNLAPLCPNCYKDMSTMGREDRIKILRESKTFWTHSADMDEFMSTADLEEDIGDLLEAIESCGPLDPNDLVTKAELRYVPVKVADKLSDEPLLCSMVKGLASTGYLKVKNALKTVSENYGGFSEILAEQILIAYKRMKASGKFNYKEEIYFALGQEIQNRTHKKMTVCLALVAYYVQDCEVFDAIAK